jgi:hypothetical protein
VICHCRDCQRASGTGHVPVMGVVRATFEKTGETTSHVCRGGSGQPSIRHFCPACGSLLFGTPQSAPDMVTIYVGSLDDPSTFRAEALIFTRDRLDWDKREAGLPEYEKLPPD